MKELEQNGTVESGSTIARPRKDCPSVAFPQEKATFIGAK
jgi:hypothetical protein